MQNSGQQKEDYRVDKRIGFPVLNRQYVIWSMRAYKCFTFTKYYQDTLTFDVVIRRKDNCGERTSKGRMSIQMAREVVRIAD